MRLALIVDAYPPARTSAAVQMSHLAIAFSRIGHDVTVFTTSNGISRTTMGEEGGINVLRVPTGKARGLSLARRALSEMLMPLALWQSAREHDVPVESFDALIWYSPSIFLGPFAYWLKKKSRARAYLILRDIFPQWAVDLGVMRRGLPYYFFRVVERFQYRVADVIGVQSPANLMHVQNDIGGSRPVEVLFNWIELDRKEPAASRVLEHHGIAGKRILVYGGNMGVGQDVDNLVRLGEHIRHDSDLALLLVGAGSAVERLRRSLAERRLENTILLDEVDPEEFRAILRRCHVGLITLDKRLTTHNIPGKLLAYLEAGLPVVASVNSGNDLITIIEDSGAGIAFTDGQDSEFAIAATALVRDRQRCAEMSQKARALVQDIFSVSSVIEQLSLAFAPNTEARV